jgi:hypothetical protein
LREQDTGKMALDFMMNRSIENNGRFLGAPKKTVDSTNERDYTNGEDYANGKVYTNRDEEVEQNSSELRGKERKRPGRS